MRPTSALTASRRNVALLRREKRPMTLSWEKAKWGTTTFEFQSPKTGKLKPLSRAILRIATGDRATARVPLEIDRSRPSEIHFHFQLTPELARHAYLDLVCPMEDMPNGTVYQVELSTF